ncbi:hypothetical protein H4R33_002554 [Dimargaris cristalligena]|nr:hypothetical protein H4R33_002554 [Dimargaris cristalligena]
MADQDHSPPESIDNLVHEVQELRVTSDVQGDDPAQGEKSADPAPSKPWKGQRALGRDPEQVIVNIIRIACSDIIADPDFESKLRTIKELFLERDYIGVFGDLTNLPIYTAQYIPGRALCYFNLFTRQPALFALLTKRPRIFCMGGGAGSELVALAAASLLFPPYATSSSGDGDSGKAGPSRLKKTTGSRSKAKTKAGPGSGPESVVKETPSTPAPLICHAQDFVDWGPTLARLETTIRDIWHIPPTWFQTEFTVGNLLDIDHDLENRIAQADLVTSLFLMNELFCQQSKAMRLVTTLIKCLKPGKHFLLVDSAGSFSQIKIGNHTYMLYKVFDSLKQHFKPIISDNNQWYRYPSHLQYPLRLDNMQYYIRLYEKL